MTTHFELERDGEVVTEGELRHVFVTAREGEKVAIPDSVREALQRHLVSAPPASP